MVGLLFVLSLWSGSGVFNRMLREVRNDVWVRLWWSEVWGAIFMFARQSTCYTIKSDDENNHRVPRKRLVLLTSDGPPLVRKLWK